MSPWLSLPESRKTVAMSRPAATNTNSPTSACSRLDSIVRSRIPAVPLNIHGDPNRGSITRGSWYALLALRGSSFTRQHLKVIDLVCQFGLRDPVEELPDAR